MEAERDVTELTALELAAKDVLASLAGSASSERAAVLALHGDLGAGKTTLTQMLARQLGVTESITSPTFVIMKKYSTTHPRFKTLVHVDAYRLASSAELRALHFENELADPDSLVVVEWAEKVTDIMPEDAVSLFFANEGQTRTLRVK